MMYTPWYLKYLRFSEASFFSMGSPRLRQFYLQKCHVIRRVDHDALREITWYSSPPTLKALRGIPVPLL